MTLPARLLVLSDGRQGAYCDGGDPAGYPVIAPNGHARLPVQPVAR